MAKTTVYIALALGAQEPAYPAYVAFRSPFRFVSGNTVVLPEPSPVALAADGTGVVVVDPGVWLVDEILPTQVFRRAVIVPESTGIVQYANLIEVTNPVEIGYGPSWAATAQQAALAAQLARNEALQAIATIERGEPNGVAPLDEFGRIPQSFLPLELSLGAIYAFVGQQLTEADIPGQVADAIAADSSIVAAAIAAIEAAADSLELVQSYPIGVEQPWRWAIVYSTGEVAIGERTDGSFYPDAFGASFADNAVVDLDGSRGWRFAVYYADTNEVAFGQRNDGTWFPDSLGGVPAEDIITRISGDSLTGGWAGYTSGLAGLVGHTVIAQGDGGRRSEWIAGRQGGQPLRVTSSTGVIPASGPVNVTVSVYDHIGATPPLYVASSYVGVLGGILGTLTITDSDTGAGSFLRATNGRETVLPAVTPFVRTQYRDAWPIIWAGRNNFKLANDGAQIVRDVRDMLSWSLRRDRALVLSIPPWSGEEIGTNVRNTLDTVNGMLRDAFPVEFVDTSAMLRSSVMLQAVGITPTATDLLNITAGLTPESFRLPGDAGHLNAKGYEALNLLIHETYQARGWV